MSLSVSPVRISISNAMFYAYHGVKAAEKELGGQYQVDLDLVYDSTAAVLSDDVQKAVNYEEALFCISEVLNGEPCDLVETLAHDILDSIMDKFSTVLEVTVRIRKMNVPLRSIVDFIEVEQTMARE